MQTLAEIEARDKYKVAVHEAGHAVVALACGWVWFRVWVNRTLTDDPIAEPTWTGRMEGPCFNDPGLVGVAGMVAEMLDEDPQVEAFSIVEYWEMGLDSPSETDLRRVPECWDQRHRLVDEALRMIRKWQVLFRGIVSELIEQEYVNDDRLCDLLLDLAGGRCPGCRRITGKTPKGKPRTGKCGKCLKPRIVGRAVVSN